MDAGRILESLNPEQREAAEATRGPLCILAGAGTGKTTTITHRIAWQVASGAFSASQVVAVTFTDKAAGELRARIRQRLRELGRQDLARDLDAAWISTIHGFCHRLLRAYPFEAGIDPRFRVVDDSQGRVLRQIARLAREGYRSVVLVSYGSYWFPWFMRRLAERPANVLFLARNLFSK